MKYEEAMAKLDGIVQSIEGNKLSIDMVGEQLKEAQKLIKFCRDKLYSTDEEIKKILEADSNQ